MTIERTIDIDVDIDEFEFKDIADAFYHLSEKPENRKVYEETIAYLELSDISDKTQWIYQMSDEDFQELYDVMANDYKFKRLNNDTTR